MKKLTVGKARKKAFRMFSKYIRLFHADDSGYCTCITCGTKKHWKEMDTGHFIHNRNSIHFDERNVNPQCTYCNRYLHGNQINYTLFMIKTYGKKIVNELIKKSKEIKRWKVYELEEIYQTYREAVKKLEGK